MENVAGDYNSIEKARENKEALETARQQKPSPINNDNDVGKDKKINGTSKNIGSKNKEHGKRKKTLNPFAVLGQIDILKDMPYFCAILASLLKEIFDIILSFTFVLPILFSFLNCIFGMMMMQLAKFSETEEKTHSRFMIRIGIFIIGAVFDSFPGLNFLPMSILTTLIVYFMTLYERANTQKTEKANS